MEIERKDRNPTPFLGMPKKRVIRGLPKAPDPVAALKSLVPDFPLDVVPEYLWGRSQAKRVSPHKFKLHFEGWTDKAWKARYQGKLYWLPKSQVFVWPLDAVRAFNLYEVWVPHWLAKKNGMLAPEVTITITSEQQEGIDRLRLNQTRTCTGCLARREVEVQEYPDQIWCSLWQLFRHDERCDEYVSGGL